MVIRWTEIAVTVLIAALLLLVEHRWPWRQVFQKEPHQVINYTLGTLALNLPLTGLFLIWGLYEVVLAMWLTIVCGGMAVLGEYVIDGWTRDRDRAKIAEREAKKLRPKVDDDDQGTETT